MGQADNNLNVMEWIEDLLELPMAVLSLLLLALLGIEFLIPLTPGQSRTILFTQWIIWVVFLVHFVVTFSLASSKRRYLRRNWIIVISLVIPFFRVLAIFRAFKAIRVLSTARLVTVTNRAIRQLGFVLQARRIIYVTLSSLIVIFISAAGIFFLERNAPGSPIDSFGVALWFTTRSVMNADVPVAPVTGEGRVLGVLISLYGFAIFGIITAALASWFIESDRRQQTRRRNKETREMSQKIQEDLRRRPVSDEEARRRLDDLIALLGNEQRAEEENE